MPLTTFRGIYSVTRIEELYIPKNELTGRVVEARDRDSYICSYTMKLFTELYKLTACIFSKIVTKGPPHSLWRIRADKRFIRGTRILKGNSHKLYCEIFNDVYSTSYSYCLMKLSCERWLTQLIRKCTRLEFQISSGNELYQCLCLPSSCAFEILYASKRTVRRYE
jgi:hypothetical protein